jgi:hypothetical protein
MFICRIRVSNPLSQQSLKQAITDNTRKAKEFGDNAEHWSEEHDKLQLNPIEYVNVHSRFLLHL